MKRLALPTLYLAFAVLAIAVNIGTQAAVIALYGGPFQIIASVLAGTATGLVAKYVLDKAFIFRFVTRSKAHEAKTFVLYTVMGIATTAIFWGTEALFHLVWKTDGMRYLGGVIGLAIGYCSKYFLDKRFVFR
ncbi:MAG: GtrA family protein [Pseudoxanthomonas sp.]|nr:GtrA family protein [Pseudoxanthomonas sp.]